MEAPGSAATEHSSRSPPAMPPAVLIRTASSMALYPVLGNMTRIGDCSKTSSMRVPFSEPLSTILQQPSARCRSLSDGWFEHTSPEQHGPASLVTSRDDIACNIGWTNWSAGRETTMIHFLFAG